MKAPAEAAGADARAAPDAGAAVLCPECEEALAGDYCHRCGERRPDGRDLSVRHFFSEAAQELTSVEHSKLVRTVAALLFRPGLLTNEWVAGRRRRYLKPLNLCLGVFALSLFAYSAYKPVSMFDVQKFIRESRSEESVRLFERLAARKRMETGALFDQLGERWQRNMSLAPLVFVGAYAVVLQLVFAFSRRYFVEHLVFSMHFVAFSILTVVLLWPVYFVVGFRQGGANTFVAVFKWAVDIVYMYFAVRAVYGLGAARTVLASLLLVFGYFATYVLVFGGAFALALVSILMS